MPSLLRHSHCYAGFSTRNLLGTSNGAQTLRFDLSLARTRMDWFLDSVRLCCNEIMIMYLPARETPSCRRYDVVQYITAHEQQPTNCERLLRSIYIADSRPRDRLIERWKLHTSSQESYKMHVCTMTSCVTWCYSRVDDGESLAGEPERDQRVQSRTTPD